VNDGKRGAKDKRQQQGDLHARRIADLHDAPMTARFPLSSY
jgi:hypothetical protein